MRRRKGKTSPFIYYAQYELRKLLPRWVRAIQRRLLLRGWQNRPDADYIRERVDFYCRRPFVANADAVQASKVERLDTPSSYLVDLQKFLRAYPGSTYLNFHGGDTHKGGNPKYPTIIKTRRLDDDTDNGVLLKLNSRRHFLKPYDPIPFRDKKPLLIFRGEMERKPHRKRFLELWHDSKVMDIADTCKPWDASGHKPPIDITEHFDYQFVLALEGNDVASALQWIMMSNCVPVMTAPTVEGWLMHSKMIPGVHYVEIASDYSDAEEKINYYIRHQQEAENISAESTEWARQFMDSRREKIISYLVLDKYFQTESS